MTVTEFIKLAEALNVCAEGINWFSESEHILALDYIHRTLVESIRWEFPERKELLERLILVWAEFSTLGFNIWHGMDVNEDFYKLVGKATAVLNAICDATAAYKRR